MSRQTDLIQSLLHPTAVRQKGRSGARKKDPMPHIKQRRLEVKARKKRVLRLKRGVACVEQIQRLPDAKHDLMMLMDGCWHGWDVVASVIELAKAPLVSLHLSTLGASGDQARLLADMLDEGEVQTVDLLVSQMFAAKDEAEWRQLVQALRDRGQHVAASRNHSKLMLLRFADGRTYSGHGSCNLRRCHSIENLTLTADPDVHAWLSAYIEGQTRPDG